MSVVWPWAALAIVAVVGVGLAARGVHHRSHEVWPDHGVRYIQTPDGKVHRNFGGIDPSGKPLILGEGR